MRASTFGKLAAVPFLWVTFMAADTPKNPADSAQSRPDPSKAGEQCNLNPEIGCTGKAAFLSGDAEIAQGAGSAPGKGEAAAGLPKTEAEWKRVLTPDQYRVMREKGTERAFTGKYWNCHTDGVYRCAGCGLELFSSKTKYDSGSGWPSFWKPVDAKAVGVEIDRSHSMVRTEVHCQRCGAHLGHVFEDGPQPTGLRYCINSVSLQLEAEKAESEAKP